MCKNYRLAVDLPSILEDFADLQIRIKLPEGALAEPAGADVRVADVAPIVKASDGAAAGELVGRRWSWPGLDGKPVHNFRSERREHASHRCLILCDGFYEGSSSDTWLATLQGHRWFCLAGVWRTCDGKEAFSLLTMDAGPDLRPYRTRQVVPLARDQWAQWLDLRVPARDILRWPPRRNIELCQVEHMASAPQARAPARRATAGASSASLQPTDGRGAFR